MLNYQTHENSVFEVDLVTPLKPFPTTNHLMTIKAIHQNLVYVSKISSLQLRTQFESTSNMTMEVFVDHFWNAITAKTTQHGCKVTPHGDRLRLEFYFNVAEGISLQLGTLELMKSTESPMVIYKQMATTITTLQTKEKDYESQIHKLKLGREHVLQKYENYVKERELADTVIFKKFADVLNEKKLKIKELSQYVFILLHEWNCKELTRRAIQACSSSLMKLHALMGISSCQEYLFFGASQVAGWQGSAQKPTFPFGKFVQDLLGVNSTILGLPGDCLGGPGCPFNSETIVTGFRARLEALFATSNKTFQWTIFLGGANDINQQCFFNNPIYVNALESELDLLTTLTLTKSQNLILMPTFRAPLYRSKCQELYQSYYDRFKTAVQKLAIKSPNRVYFFDSTSLILYFRDSYFYDDLHLNADGNRALGQGIIREILKITNSVVKCGITRIDCGYIGVDVTQCMDAGCCWSPMPKVPWCFMKQ